MLRLEMRSKSAPNAEQNSDRPLVFERGLIRLLNCRKWIVRRSIGLCLYWASWLPPSRRIPQGVVIGVMILTGLLYILYLMNPVVSGVML